MPSRITLTLTGIPTVNSLIIKSNYGVNAFTEDFVEKRTTNYQTKIEATEEATLLSLFNSIQADYNASSLFDIIINESNTILTIEYPEEDFFTALLYTDDSGVVDAVFDNSADAAVISVNSEIFSEALIPCDNVVVNLTTNVLATSYKINGGVSIVNSANPILFDWIRNNTFNILLDNGAGSTLTHQVTTPDRLVSAGVDVTYINSPSGATITIYVENQYGLNLTYSLDDSTYITENVYTGILEGDYTIYVKDQLGCKVSVLLSIPNFEGNGVGERIPYSDLPSKSNSIRFSKYIQWGTCGDYKNDENTLSCQLPYTENALEYYQLFQNCDLITTQIKTNYNIVTVTIIEEDETETELTAVKKSSNTGLKDMRDATMYNIDDLGIQTGIFFISGEKYNPETGLPYSPSQSYTLNGSLPAWGVIGNYIFLNGGWFQIVNIIYDKSKGAYVLVINIAYTGIDATVQVLSIYNLESYDIWEFIVDMSLFSNRKIQINISETDDNTTFYEQIYLSEIIYISEVQEGSVYIEYYNDDNTDIFYATGIKNKIRMPIEYFSGGYGDITESERTDSETYLIDAETYENDTIAFKLMPKQMMRKVVQALSHKFVFLNGVQYVKEESPEITGLIGSNQYRVTAKMTKANAVYTSKGIGQTFSTNTLEIPSLILADSQGYLKIKN